MDIISQNVSTDMKGKISKRTVDALQPGQTLADTEIRGFVCRCLPSGTRSYGLRYRAGGKQHWFSIGEHGRVTADEARRLARKRAGEIADNRNPALEKIADRAKAQAETAIPTVNALLDDFLKLHGETRKLRSLPEYRRIFDRYVRPAIGTIRIDNLRRADIVAMLDAIEAPVQADKTLALVRKAFRWQMTRDERFLSPIVPGMARTSPKERERARVLDDQEIRDIWRALDTMTGEFPRIVRVLLLTGQRRDEVGLMRWAEIHDDATWVIPGSRYKTKQDQAVPLAAPVLAIVGMHPRDRDGYVFPGKRGPDVPFTGFGASKGKLDRAINDIRKADGRPPISDWRLHDLRRTARSLMSRAGVPADIGERVLGHVISGVRGVYDRHKYSREKRDALEKLAGLIEHILNPKDNVVQMKRV
jgi:integrase